MVQARPVRIERRLSAILAGDAAGYSRLMHNDEEPTHAKLTALLMDAVNPAIAEHGGRIVKNTGDGFLAEFPSAVEAVRAAMLFQTRIHELTIGDAEDRRLRFRVGINIGDVIVEPHDIFGDGVNIAARLESIAEPGGICISSSAYDQVLGKITVEFVDLGEQHLKNIARPVRVYHVRLNGTSIEATPALPDKPSIAAISFNNVSGAPEGRRRSGGAGAVPRRTVLAAAGSTVALGLGGLVYMLWPRLLVPTPKFAGTHRTALVIGNAQYRFVPPLGNPMRDADSVSAALEQRGFRVIRVIDADGRQTTEAVTDFERTLSVAGGVGIFYYAGRAVYIDGDDILMPVDVKLNSTQLLEGGVNLTTLQAQVQAKTTPKFVGDGSAVIYPRQGAKSLTMDRRERTHLSRRRSSKPSPTTRMNSAIFFDASVRPWTRSRASPSKSRRPISRIRVRSNSISTDPKPMRRSARSKFLSSMRVATIP